MKTYSIHLQDLQNHTDKLTAGDRVLLSGVLYTARDAAHKRIFSLLGSGTTLPFPLEGSVIYYAGPTPTPPGGLPVGSCGPTTSGRMDPYAPRLIELGLLGMVGKGGRSQAVCDTIKRRGAVYFCATGGAGALYAKAIKHLEVIAFEELGCESVKRMMVEDFPVFVGIDPKGGSLFGRAAV